MKIAKKLLSLICVTFLCSIIAMEFPSQETDRTLEALSLAIPNYPKYTNLTNYKEAYKEINNLINVFDKSAKENLAFSFLKYLKKEYELLDKQKAKLIGKFDLTSSHKKLQQEKTRLAQLEQQLTEKSKTLQQLAEKVKEDTQKAQNINQEAYGIINEYRESKLTLQSMLNQNENYISQLNGINDILNNKEKKQELETEKQNLEIDFLALKQKLTELIQSHENIQELNQQKDAEIIIYKYNLANAQKQIQSETSKSKSFLQRYPKIFGLGFFIGSILTGLISVRYYIVNSKQ